MNLIVDEVKLLEEEYNGQAPMSVLKSNMEEKHGVSEDKVESLVRSLQQRGILYEPNIGSGYWKRV
jgi:replicative DNA helicase Mcm